MDTKKSGGVSGNRSGNKMYCFNTSIRVPDKNIEYLRVLKKYEGKLFTDALRIDFYKEAIQCGAVTPVNMSKSIKERINRGEKLTDSEMTQVLKKNKPKNGFTGRVGDYILSLENQALIQRLGTSRKFRVRLTDLGNKLLESETNELDVYTKAMIGLEYGSPSRDNVKNRSIPFLNTIYIIDYLRKYYESKKVDFKGLTLFEFGVFVLTMKNCKYENACQKIIEYRNKFGVKENQDYAFNYLKKNNIQKYDKDTIFGSGSYADEVLRKFKKTGLITEKSHFKTRYINFNNHELAKIDLLIEEYKDYSWKKFKNADDYYEKIETIILPWEKTSSNYYKILQEKADKINYALDVNNTTREEYDRVNKLYYQYVFENNDYSQFPYENIIKELGLINKTVDGDSVLQDVEEYVRLEWFTSLLLANKFGKDKVKANLILDDDGLPLSQATGNNADIELEMNDVKYNIEVTTIRNRTQQLNSETTTVARHLASNNEDGAVKLKALLVAPFIHEDTIRYYKFEANESNVMILPITIDLLITIVEKSENFEDFDNTMDRYCNFMKESKIVDYEKLINEKINYDYTLGIN